MPLGEPSAIFTLNLCDCISVSPSVSLPELLCFSFSHPLPSICRRQYYQMIIDLDSEHRLLRPESQKVWMTPIIQSAFMKFIHSFTHSTNKVGAPTQTRCCGSVLFVSCCICGNLSSFGSLSLHLLGRNDLPFPVSISPCVSDIHLALTPQRAMPVDAEDTEVTKMPLVLPSQGSWFRPIIRE